MPKSEDSDNRLKRLARERAVDELVTAIDDLIEERVREATSRNPYYSGSVYEAQKTLHVKLRTVLELPDPDQEENEE